MGKGMERNIGGLLGVDPETLTPAEREQARRLSQMAVFDALARGTTPFEGLRGAATTIGAQREQRQLRERETAAQEQAARISGRLFGDDLSARVITPEEAIKLGNPKLAGTIRPRQDLGQPPQPDTGELTGVSPMSRYVSDPREAMRMAMTPAGIDALKVNPLLSTMMTEYIKPKEMSLTEKQKLYSQAVAQGYEGTILDFLQLIEASGAPKIGIDVGQKGTNKAQETLAAAEATTLSEDRNSARSALRVWNGAQTLIDLSTKEGAVSGALAPNIIGANNFLVSIFGKGVAQEAMADAEKFNAAVSQLVIDQMSSLGGARGFSREETALLERSFPQIATSPQARIAIARLLQAKAEENINSYNQSLSDFKEAFPGIKTSLKSINLPGRNVAPPPGTNPAPPLR